MAAVLFSGHMVDAPDRTEPRFPPDRVPLVRRHIAEVIRVIDDPEERAVSGLACGGDLLFAEEWLKTGRALQAFLPRPVGEFLDESVRFAGEEWVESFHRVINDPMVSVVGPDEKILRLEDPHTANNLRMLEAAHRQGGAIHGVFLWDGSGGDGPGGTQQLVSEVLDAGGTVTILDPNPGLA
ncbi:MAG: hypothetical protein ACRDZM_02010 [Acidimicrobiia bacterium]